MKIISVFNNKGGVGKSTLSYHLGHALGKLNKKVLFIDLDPQCNLTINSIDEHVLEKIWQDEQSFISDFEAARKNIDLFNKLKTSNRSIHFILKPTEDGQTDLEKEDLPPPIELSKNVSLIPGRLSIQTYENKIAERWSALYQGDNLAIRTVTNIRRICDMYAEVYGYDYIIVGTSPNLGIFNKVVISTVDGFFIPTQPDMFSLFGIRNIGNSLELWQNEFDTIYKLISTDKRKKFPRKFVQCIGFTIYNAKKYDSKNNDYGLADAHYKYATAIPDVIEESINVRNRANVADIRVPIGNFSVIHTHNAYPSVAQALKCPMWEVPEVYKELEAGNLGYLKENSIEVNLRSYGKYEKTLKSYIDFCYDFINRAEVL